MRGKDAFDGAVLRRREDPFVYAPSLETIQHPDLSFAARGLLSYLFSRPDGQISTHGLCDIGQVDEAELEDIFDELKAVGYLVDNGEGGWKLTRIPYEKVLQ